MKRFKITLKYKVLLAFLLILVPIIFTLLMGFQNARKTLEKEMLENLRHIADEREAYVLMFLELNMRRIEDFSTDGVIVEKLEERRTKGVICGISLGEYMRRYKLPILKNMYRLSIISSADGKALASTEPGIEGADLSGQGFFIRGRNGLNITELTSGHMGMPEIAVSSPVYSREDGALLGVVTGFSELAKFGEIFSGEYVRKLGALSSETMWSWKTMEIYLVNREKLMLTESRFIENAVLRQKVDTAPVRACLEKNNEITGTYKDYRGIEVAGASMCMPSLGWTLLVEVDSEEVFAPVLRTRRYSLLTLSAVVGFLSLLVLYFLRTFIRQLNILVSGAAQVASGNYDVSIPVPAAGELGLLSESFNRMVKEVKERTGALLSSEAKLEDAQRLAHLGNWDWDIEKNTLWWSDEVYRIFGAEPLEFTATYDAFLSYVHPDDRRLVDKAVRDALYGGKSYSIDCRVVLADGTEKTVHAQAEVSFDGQGNPVRMFGTVQDITGQRRAEEALRESEELLRGILDNMGNVVYLKDPEGRHILVNRQFESVAGKKREDVYGKTNYDLFPKELSDIFSANDGEALKSEEPLQFVESMPQSDGVHTYISIKFPIKDTRGNAYAVCGVSTDITQLKRTEEALRRSEASLENAQRIAHIGSWDFDIAENILYRSDEVFRIFGRSREELKTYNDLVSAMHPLDRGFVEGAFKEAVYGNKPYSLDARIIRGDGAERIVHIQGESVRDEAGRPVGMSGTVQDITERKRAEEEVWKLNLELEQRVEERTVELQKANKDLEAANRGLESFSYTVAHDLRTPLRLIDGFSRVLFKKQKDRLDEAGREHLERIMEAALRMGKLIDYILNLSYVTRAEISFQTVDLSEMAASVINDLRVAQPGREAEFRLETGLRARGDEKFLRIVLENLLGNAWKFTGKVPYPVIEFGRAGQENGRAVFFVRDNGAGFDMKYADKVFEAFERLHSKEEFPGTGVGLATVQRIINRHGGRIWAESEPGKGATFYFTIEKA